MTTTDTTRDGYVTLTDGTVRRVMAYSRWAAEHAVPIRTKHVKQGQMVLLRQVGLETPRWHRVLRVSEDEVHGETLRVLRVAPIFHRHHCGRWPCDLRQAGQWIPLREDAVYVLPEMYRGKLSCS